LRVFSNDMHLEGPWLSTTGKKRGPRKWASAEAKRKAELLKEEWEQRLGNFKKMAPKFSSYSCSTSPNAQGTLTVKNAYATWTRNSLELRVATPVGCPVSSTRRSGLHRYQGQGYWYHAQVKCCANFQR
jgi:hypothetical protein